LRILTFSQTFEVDARTDFICSYFDFSNRAMTVWQVGVLVAAVAHMRAAMAKRHQQ
jgi:hypothetical protein